MPISITQAQKGNMSSIAGIGEQFEDTIVFTGVAKEMKAWADKFMLNLAKTARENEVVATGKLLSDSETIIFSDKIGFQIKLLNYYDYPNKGVRGVMSTKNAPNSPYKFKSLYTMAPEGRRSLKNLIEQGKIKIRTVQGRERLIGLERKKKSLIDTKVDELIYNIKRYGIKQTNYFDEAVQMTFNENFYVSMSEAIGNDIIYTIKPMR